MTLVTSSQKKSLLEFADSRKMGALAAMLPATKLGYLNLMYALSIPP